LEVLNECGYTIVPEITQKECEVAIMFDDGFRGLWDCRDFFSERGIKPTVFIAKSLVGKEGYLTESEIVELDRMGWRMQSHTVSHVSLNDFTEDELDYEFIESKRYLESILGHPVTEVCAPLGRISNLVCERGYKAGYTLFYSCMPGNYDEPVIGYKYVLKRNLCQFLSPLQFKLAISGGYKIFQKRYLIRNYKH
jgi:peptidoglycan/xylan/chitin deacetylase (PgdA/CDA1 family)